MKTQFTPGYEPTSGEWNDSLAGDFLWSSVNTREAVPDIMTPYTWSMIRACFNLMTMLPGYPPVGNICGRAYNNASAGATAFHALGFKTFDASSAELYGVDMNTLDEWNVPMIAYGFADRFRVMLNAFRLMASTRKAMKNIETQVAANPTWCKAQHQQLAAIKQEELLTWSENVLLPRVFECFWWMVSPAIPLAKAVNGLRRDLLQLVGPDDTVDLLSNVSGENESLASLEPVVGLDRVRRGLMSREEYLTLYGHRSPHEAEMSTPRPAENPGWIEEQTAGLNQSPVEIDHLLAEQHERYKAAIGRLRQLSGSQFEALLRRLKETSRLTRLRESARSESVRTVWVARRFALQVGMKFGVESDIFFLEFGEIVDLLRSRRNSLEFIPSRIDTYQKYCALPQYPTKILGEFNPIQWAADPNRSTHIYDTRGRITRKFTDSVQGLPGSAGLAEGLVRVLNSPEEGVDFRAGEILVAVTTNVGWTPLFPRAAGVITDVGAPLSHAAIVARELGIPAVVGSFNATRLLRTGDRVQVDGAKGVVKMLDREGGK